MSLHRRAVAVCCALLTAVSVGAQRVEARLGAPSSPPLRNAADTTPPAGEKSGHGPFGIPRRDSSWWVPLASTVLPGAGQALLGQNRFVAYLAVEGYVVADYLSNGALETRERNRSRALANDVARALFPGSRPRGTWAYYESMEHFVESGVFNRFPGGEFSPEVDPVTYNGWLWLDVRRRFWNNPSVEPDHGSKQYRDALNEYIARAVRDEMRWSWRNAQLEQDLYRRSILIKNQAAHTATSLLGLLVANRLLSTVDAFITLRLRGAAGAVTSPGSPTSLSVTVPWAPFGRSSKP
jgi:hypothetical protein